MALIGGFVVGDPGLEPGTLQLSPSELVSCFLLASLYFAEQDLPQKTFRLSTIVLTNSFPHIGHLVWPHSKYGPFF